MTGGPVPEAGGPVPVAGGRVPVSGGPVRVAGGPVREAGGPTPEIAAHKVLAVVPVRFGVLPAGGDEAVAEAGGAAMVVGDDTMAAAGELRAALGEVLCAEVGAFAPGAWAQALAPWLGGVDAIIVPGSPDGRDLAPRLARVLGRPLLAGAVQVGAERVVLATWGGLVTEVRSVSGPFVATLQPGVRGVVPAPGMPTIRKLEITIVEGGCDARVLDVLPPDPATMDLAEARRIVAGGSGLGGPEPFELLRRVAGALGASWGASRVAADAGWVPQDRFIGTTGVTIGARLYFALGISGAVQHVAGLGDPDHIIAVNVDASAPMMSMADLAVVTDAPALLVELAQRLGVSDD